jgi:outer membrane receptor for ferrienterochelin and colicins
MKTLILFSVFIVNIILAFGQNQTIEGYVYDKSTSAQEALFGANIVSEDGLHGTISDQNGYFTLSLPNSYKKVFLSYVGYTDTKIDLPASSSVTIYMESNVLDEVESKYKKLDRSTIETYNSQILDGADLTKAACCNLSESFETNAAVDVSFSDAVTGAKRIRMLGLDSYYTQIMFENQPSIRGLANSFGMLYVPGPFMKSIAINRGAGSVTDGYEAITGQINYTYKDPNDSERFYLNLFGSRHGQFEINTNASHRFSDKWSTVVFAHGMIHEIRHDNNDDSFQDVPLTERIVVTNKWFYDSKKVFKSRFGFSYTYDEREAGQLSALPLNQDQSSLFQTTNINRRYDAFAKTGFLLPNKLQSVGIQYRFYNHQHNAWYGDRFYNGVENFAKLNFIFQTKMQDHKNEMKLGFSYLFNDFVESVNSLQLDRRESVPGIFAEYTYQDYEKLSFIFGIRGDFHNQHGFWLSPKANFKYNLPKQFTIKLSAGKGYRTPNLIAENIGALASNRQLGVSNTQGFESAWNTGGSLLKKFYLGFQQGSIAIDYYRTDFQDRMVFDYETPGQLNFYQLEGKSYANSFQVETNIEAADGLDFQLAYKFDDVHITYESGMKLAPYIPRHKMLLTADYETKNEKWRFNLTGQLNGKSRLPSTSSNPIAYQRPDESKVFFTMNSQVTAVVKKWEFYIGGENITNYWQENPIIAADQVESESFDASMIWGPLGGVRLYGGLRWTLPYKNDKKKN